ncbi:5-(carboxyamino)imidazole ribonucleotide synthase [Microbulbifer marinus]|uniref:N5-carboxyaminoimidazole ribonucleotide synthase n=1 Tax=Microbulbifer marinus TaxID=658218 RepID=A0A1H3W2Y5_9GAMM|nr:5-(carboxyamino)imidazole ribonucleotide synthase [Microbulbifer marinus]SDZ81467.1 5-(carboxyamino)imidazole ribonucleotide synthase [Microbulbifer marinus]
MATRRVAIVGCGQLAQMMAREGRPLGIEFSFVAEHGESTGCVEGLGEIVHAEAFDSAEALYQALGNPEVITAEREQVQVPLLRELEQFCPVFPRPDALADTQHRLREKQALVESGIPVAPFLPANSYEEICRAIESLGYPAFIKSCENGYDGKNQWRVDNPEQLGSLSEVIKPDAYVVEKGVNFIREISLIGARSRSGEVKIYPLAENHHQDGTLLLSLAPAAAASDETMRAAESYLTKLLNDWDYVGALAMECFATDEGLLVNELAPRVHNSGHWTLGGAATSQFENHVRAILDLPLGSTSADRPTAMINLLGVDVVPDAVKQSATNITLYGKTLKPRRKMGHMLLQSEDMAKLRDAAQKAIDLIYQTA